MNKVNNKPASSSVPAWPKKAPKARVQKMNSKKINTETSERKTASNVSNGSLDVDSESCNGSAFDHIEEDSNPIFDSSESVRSIPHSQFNTSQDAISCTGDGINLLNGPRITDLCPDDKKRILALVNEIATIQEKKDELTKELQYAKEKLTEQQDQITTFSEKFAIQRETLLKENANLKVDKEMLLSEMEEMKRKYEVQKNEINKLHHDISAVPVLKADKKKLQIQVADQTLKLKAAVSTIEVLNKELKKLKGMKKVLKDGFTQVPDSTTKVPVKDNSTNRKTGSATYGGNSKVTRQAYETDAKRPERDQDLITELFFRSGEDPETLEPVFLMNEQAKQQARTWATWQ